MNNKFLLKTIKVKKVFDNSETPTEKEIFKNTPIIKTNKNLIICNA